MFRSIADRIRIFVGKYERFIIAGSLLAGFLFDNWLLTSVDVLWNNLLLGSYLLIAAFGISLYHIIEEHKLSGWKSKFIGAIMPIVVQYSFGNLFSGLIIFYGRSAEVATSWIFVIILVLLVAFSEAFSQNYRRFRYQITIWFFLLLAYSAFFLPVIIGAIGPWVFLLGVVLSIGILRGFIFILQALLPNRINRTKHFLIGMAVIIAGAFTTLYVLNWIPPLPLALKEASVAHSVVRVEGAYVLSVEPKKWWNWYSRYHSEYHYSPGEAVYAYSAVFAPTRLDTKVVHEWQHYDEQSEKWQTTNSVTFPISGGRDGGYRGYSLKSALMPGKWRVNVKTDYGAIIGRITFTAIPDDINPVLKTEKY